MSRRVDAASQLQCEWHVMAEGGAFERFTSLALNCPTAQALERRVADTADAHRRLHKELEGAALPLPAPHVPIEWMVAQLPSCAAPEPSEAPQM